MENAPDRFSTFLSLSGEGIARFELDEPLRPELSEDEQVEHLLRHGRLAECNELFARFYGRAAGELGGQVMGDLFPTEEPGRLDGIRQFIRSGYRLVHAEEEHPRPDGPSRWISGSALGALEEGRLRAFWLCLRDVTDRKRAEADRERRGRILEAVAFSAARLLRPGSWRAQADAVLERLGHAAGVARVWLAQFEEAPGGLRYAFRSAWGAPGAEVRLDDPRIAAGVSVRAAGLERLAEEIRAGRPVVTRVADLTEAEQVLPREWGSRAFAAVPVIAHDRPWGFLGFGETRYARDWSSPEVEALKAAAALWGAAIEREQADSAFRETEEQLRQARLMESMGGLVAGVAHEVRNPLFSISATVDALEAELGPRPEFAEYATLLRSQVNRLTQLMRDLLDYGKPSVLRRAPTSLGEVVRRAVRACATLARERKVSVEEYLPADLPSLDLDGARMEQALENLLANAIQHAPPDSVVRVRAELETGPSGPRLRCTIEDEGPGLPADGERLFEPFVSRRQGGTGLGLPIVQRVVAAHGGRVTAENREGGGARFTVHLPAARPASTRRDHA